MKMILDNRYELAAHGRRLGVLRDCLYLMYTRPVTVLFAGDVESYVMPNNDSHVGLMCYTNLLYKNRIALEICAPRETEIPCER